jgi:hypothetical protein
MQIGRSLAPVLNHVRKNKWVTGSILVTFCWYVSLFPGRLGSDPAKAILLMRQGLSTDWWTAQYFWTLKLTSINGQHIWLASLISLIVLYACTSYFIFSMPENKSDLQKTLFIICLSPLFGNFAVNISHDVFFTSGILLTIGFVFRQHYNQLKPIDKVVPFGAVIALTNTKSGFLIVIVFMLYFIFINQVLARMFPILALTIFTFLMSSVGVTKTDVPMHLLPALADLKCVAQHPDAKITEEEWRYLEKIYPLEKWKSPKTCSSMDDALIEMSNDGLYRIELKLFLRNYISISLNNPAIVIQAHLQRSSVALPPPFFQGPPNQVDRNINNPVGLNTNTALQLGPSVLHPSVDLPDQQIDSDLLKPIESVALLASFFFNQASWFWGWGGLWLWPVLIYLVFKLKIRGVKNLLVLTFPIIVTHLSLVVVGPISAPRYVMSTILIGNITSIILVRNLLNSSKFKGERN